MDFSVFHDDEQALVGVFEDLAICNRIPVHEQQIRECAVLHHAEFAGIRIARSIAFLRPKDGPPRSRTLV